MRRNWRLEFGPRVAISVGNASRFPTPSYPFRKRKTSIWAVELIVHFLSNAALVAREQGCDIGWWSPLPVFRLCSSTVMVRSLLGAGGRLPLGQRVQDLQNPGGPYKPWQFVSLAPYHMSFCPEATNTGQAVCTESSNEFLLPPLSPPTKILTVMMSTRRKWVSCTLLCFYFSFLLRKTFLFDKFAFCVYMCIKCVVNILNKLIFQ